MAYDASYDAGLAAIAADMPSGSVSSSGGPGYLVYNATVSLLAGCFVCRTEGPFTFADGEITEAHWVSQEELPVWLGAKPFLPDSVALVLPRLWRE